MRTTNALFIWMSCYAVGGPEQVVYFYPYKPPKDVKISTPTQHPTIPWSSLLRQRPRQCLSLQLTQQGWRNYQEISSGLIALSVCKPTGLIKEAIPTTCPWSRRSALLSVCGGCSFGGLGCCSCRVCVCVCRCRGCWSLSVCVCVSCWYFYVFGPAQTNMLASLGKGVVTLGLTRANLTSG